jgi:hypothetical protein
LRIGDNPARWRGHLDELLPAPNKVRAVKHHPAMSRHEVSQFMAGRLFYPKEIAYLSRKIEPDIAGRKALNRVAYCIRR